MVLNVVLKLLCLTHCFFVYCLCIYLNVQSRKRGRSTPATDTPVEQSPLSQSHDPLAGPLCHCKNSLGCTQGAPLSLILSSPGRWGPLFLGGIFLQIKTVLVTALLITNNKVNLVSKHFF